MCENSGVRKGSEYMNLYGKYEASLEGMMNQVRQGILAYGARRQEENGEMIFEHLRCRVKSEESMEKKLASRGLPLTAKAAFYDVRDAAGFRVVCRFIDDIYENIEEIRKIPGVSIVKEKDYIRHVKPNGYRSYHLILQVTAPFEDPLGRCPGQFYAEVQLRTIAMDSWAALEHDMRYKKRIAHAALIERELKRCADELASCDVSMQTIRNLIDGKE